MLHSKFHSTLYLKNVVFWDVRRVAFVRTDVLQKLIASIISVTRIDELGAASAVTSSRSTQHA
jgi:hypothetical protein